MRFPCPIGAPERAPAARLSTASLGDLGLPDRIARPCVRGCRYNDDTSQSSLAGLFAARAIVGSALSREWCPLPPRQRGCASTLCREGKYSAASRDHSWSSSQSPGALLA